MLNQHEHWYTLRRFGPALTHPADDPGEGHWFNLNSTLDRPEWISKLYLGMFLQQAETEGTSVSPCQCIRTRTQHFFCAGYSIFVVLQRDPAAPLALPRTEADEIAMAIPESSGTRAAPAAHTGIEGLEDEDMELQAALQASLMGGAAAYGLPQHGYPAPVSASSTDPIFGSRSGAHTPVQRHGYGVLAPPHGYEDEDEELDDPVIPDFVPGVPGSAAHDGDPLAASRARSEAYMARVLREQEAALRDSYAEEAARIEAGGAPRRNARAEQEEAELLRAIEESRAMHEALGDAPPPTAEPEPPRPARPLQADRVYDDEDAELQAALRASLETLPEGFRIPSTPPRGAPPPLPPASTRPVPSQSQPQPRPQAPQAEDDGFETESEADTEASASAAPEPQLSMDEIRRRRLAKFGG